MTSQTALATGEVAVLVGGGEYAVSGLHAEKPNLDWVLPDEGGVRWQQAIGVFEDLPEEGGGRQVHPVRAVARGAGPARHLLLLLGYARQRQGDAERRAEAGPALERAADLHQELHLYIAPTDALDQAMQAVWQEFLAK